MNHVHHWLEMVTRNGKIIALCNSNPSLCKQRGEGGVMKNLCAKTRKTSEPYEVWQSRDGSWTWNVLKKWQADDDKPYARWFCNVVTPICPDGELGDVYVSEIKQQAKRIK